MVTVEVARSLVEGCLAEMPPAFPGDRWVVVSVEEFRSGWTFSYDSDLSERTGESQYLVAGNAPFIFRKIDGAVFVMGTAFPIERYIEDFETGGGLTRRCT